MILPVIQILICVEHRKPLNIHFWGSASGCPSSWLLHVCGLKKKKKLVLLMCSHNLSAAACKLIAGCFWGTARRPAWCRCGASDLYPGEGESLQSDPEWGGWGCTAASGWPKCQGQGLRERQLRGSHHPQQYHSMWVYVFNNTVTLSTCKGNPLIRSPSCSLRWGATLKRFSGLCWWFLRQRL